MYLDGDKLIELPEVILKVRPDLPKLTAGYQYQSEKTDETHSLLMSSLDTATLSRFHLKNEPN